LRGPVVESIESGRRYGQLTVCDWLMVVDNDIGSAPVPDHLRRMPGAHAVAASFAERWALGSQVP